jgi:hypothetical protein
MHRKLTSPVIHQLFTIPTRNTSLALNPLHDLSIRTVCSLPFNPCTGCAEHPEEPPAGQLRFASPATVDFTASLLSSASSMFRSKFFSTGGDEINTKCYDDDEQTQVLLNETRQTLEQALDAFTQKTHAALRAQGKSAVVWEG